MADDLMMWLSPGATGAITLSTAMTSTMARYGRQLSGEPPAWFVRKSWLMRSGSSCMSEAYVGGVPVGLEVRRVALASRELLFELFDLADESLVLLSQLFVLLLQLLVLRPQTVLLFLQQEGLLVQLAELGFLSVAALLRTHAVADLLHELLAAQVVEVLLEELFVVFEHGVATQRRDEVFAFESLLLRVGVGSLRQAVALVAVVVVRWLLIGLLVLGKCSKGLQGGEIHI